MPAQLRSGGWGGCNMAPVKTTSFFQCHHETYANHVLHLVDSWESLRMRGMSTLFSLHTPEACIS